MIICLQDRSEFGTIQLSGIHQVLESTRDVEQALETAERDGFDRIFFYVQGLHTADVENAVIAALNLLPEGSDLNGWRVLGSKILDLRNQLTGALTWKQYRKLQAGSDDYISWFKRVRTITKSERILSIADRGIKFCNLAQAINNRQSPKRMWDFPVAKTQKDLEHLNNGNL